MHNFLFHIFSLVCGENPQHIWSPGGQPLPCCERCTGLYVAALVAVILRLSFQPCISKRFLQIHVLCLLQLGLFIFPWLPQSPVLRTISGSLFGFGVVAFLWPAVASWHRPLNKFRTRVYLSGMTVCLALTPIIAKWGGVIGANVLMILVLAGALALVVLIAINLLRCINVFFSKGETHEVPVSFSLD
jgi:uncharacterized membrane protein